MDDVVSRADRRAATAERILAAAQAEFGELGTERATIRGIARRAGVDPSLVLQHHGSKQALFAAAVQPVEDLVDDDVPHHLAEVVQVRLRELPPATRALMRSMLTSPEAAAAVREHLHDRAARLAGASSRPDADLRAAVLVSSILGLTIARHFLDLPELDGVDPEQVAALVEPWFADLV